MNFRFAAPGVLVLALLSGCSHQENASPSQTLAPQSTSSPKPVSIASGTFPSDDLNRPIHLKAPANRVVVIGPGAVETMYVLGAQSQLVGKDDYANYPSQAKAVAVGGDFNGPNVEQCIALRPDLIIVQGETSSKARFEEWQTKIGKPVAALTTTNFRSLAGDFRKLGAWIGKEKEAETLAKQFEIPSPKATHTALVQTGDASGWIAGTGTLVSDTVEHAGFKNIASVLGISGYKQINFESLLVHPPDVVIVPSSKSKEAALASLRSVPALAKLPCVQKGRVLVVDSDLLLRPGPRLLQGVEEMKKQASNLNLRSAQTATDGRSKGLLLPVACCSLLAVAGWRFLGVKK